MLYFLSTLFTPAFAQTNQTDWNTFTITTYYPSPHGVYNRMEVKRALSVGNFTDAPSGLGSVLDLDGGQLFVGESMILKSQPSAPSDGLAGQLIYVNNTATNERMLKFHNGTDWVNVTSACTTGQSCKPNNYVAPNTCTASGYTCLPNNYTVPCASGYSCQPTLVATITYQVDCGWRSGSTCPTDSHETGNVQGYCTSKTCCSQALCGNQICCPGSACPWSASCVSNSS